MVVVWEEGSVRLQDLEAMATSPDPSRTLSSNRSTNSKHDDHQMLRLDLEVTKAREEAVVVGDRLLDTTLRSQAKVVRHLSPAMHLLMLRLDRRTLESLVEEDSEVDEVMVAITRTDVRNVGEGLIWTQA
jgi:hypothetical protein